MSDVSYIARLTMHRLTSLLDPAAPPDTKAIGILHENAATGDPDSIELLLNLAARPDEVGREAEDALFDLFSGKPDKDAGIHDIRADVPEEIARQSLRMFESYETLRVLPHQKDSKLATPADTFFHSGSDKNETNKFANPSKLLYMAGAATTPAQHIRQEITTRMVGEAAGAIAHDFMDDAFPMPKADPKKPEAPLKRDDPWSRGRFMTGTELSNGLSAAAQKPAAIELSLVTSSEFLGGQSPILSKSFKEAATPVFAAIQHDNHWLSLVVYKDSGKPKALLFDSSGGYYEDRTDPAGRHRPGLKHKLDPILKGLGIETKGFEIVQADLQGNAPNSCGVYTLEAFKRLANLPAGLNPDDVLHDLVASYKGKPAEQDKLNLNGRREIHGALIDAVRQDMGLDPGKAA